MSDISHRIEKIMKDNNLNYRSLSQELGYTDVAVRNIVKGKSIPKFDFLEALFNKFPSINTYWLITGKGKQYIEGDGNVLGSLPVEDISQWVVSRQSEFLKDTLFNEFIEKVALKKMLEIERGGIK